MREVIGLCTWIFGHQRHGEIAAIAAALGCDGVELHVAVEPDLATEAQPALALRRLYAAHGLRILSLTPQNVDLAHQDLREQDRALDHYRGLIDLAAALDSPAITIHEHVGRGAWPDSREREWQRLVSACRVLVAQAEARRVDLLLEPLRPPLVSQIHTAADAVRLCDAVGSPRLRIVLDTFHMDAAGEEVGAAIGRCAGRLGAVQLADRQRRGLGRGGIDLPAYWRGFEAIGFRGPWILECAVGLDGPSMESHPVNIRQLRTELESSLTCLRRYLEGRAPLPSRP